MVFPRVGLWASTFRVRCAKVKRCFTVLYCHSQMPNFGASHAHANVVTGDTSNVTVSVRATCLAGIRTVTTSVVPPSGLPYSVSVASTAGSRVGGVRSVTLLVAMETKDYNIGSCFPPRILKETKWRADVNTECVCKPRVGSGLQHPPVGFRALAGATECPRQANVVKNGNRRRY